MQRCWAVALGLVLAVSCGGDDRCPPDFDLHDGRCLEHAGEGEGEGKGEPPCEVPLSQWRDEDGDGWGDLGAPALSCVLRKGFARRSGDCDDRASATHPGALEACNEIDDDCDGTIDAGLQGPRSPLMTIAVDEANEWNRALAWTGEDYAVAWTNAGLWMMRGAPATGVTSGPLLVSDEAFLSDMVLDHDLFLVHIQSGTPTDELVSTRLGILGDLRGRRTKTLEASWQVTALRAFAGPQGGLAVLGVRVADTDELHVFHDRGDGLVESAILSAARAPDVARDPRRGDVIVAWIDGEHDEVAVAALDDTGAIATSPTILSETGGAATAVALAVSAGVRLAAVTTDGGRGPLLAIPFGMDLAPRADGAVVVETDGAVSAGSAAAGPDHALVAFTLDGGAWVTRRRPDGLALEKPLAIEGAVSPVAPRVTWNGQGYGITMSTRPDDPDRRDLDVALAEYGCR